MEKTRISRSSMREKHFSSFIFTNMSIIYKKVIILLDSSRNYSTFIFYLKNIFKSEIFQVIKFHKTQYD